jgi:hypothetical protein
MNRKKILPSHIAIDIVTGILLEELDQTTGCKKPTTGKKRQQRRE